MMHESALVARRSFLCCREASHNMENFPGAPSTYQQGLCTEGTNFVLLHFNFTKTYLYRSGSDSKCFFHLNLFQYRFLCGRDIITGTDDFFR